MSYTSIPLKSGHGAIEIRTLDLNTKEPTKSGCGLLLYCPNNIHIAPGSNSFPLNLSIQLPEGYYGRIVDIGTLSVLRTIHVFGHVEPGYNMNANIYINVINCNINNDPVYLTKNEIIGKLIIEKYELF